MPGTQGRYLFRVTTILSGTAILLGGLIYIFLRPGEPLFLDWARATGLGSLVDHLRPGSFDPALLPAWSVYSLPGALWAFAYSLTITGIWSGSHHPVKFLWLATIPVLVLGFELLQAPGIIPGTFSILDLVFGILGAGAGFLFPAIILKSTRHESRKQ
ncbi:MAG: hypothetical protein EHM46_05330 [Bacteroidetes bacterium]|nr:MAG: hypothetical protein EHM46_05330 [Bacteroidota bacterium]